MPKVPPMNYATEPRIFQDLRRYTRSEVETVNVGAYLLEQTSSWRKWIEETFRELLAVSQGLSLSIVRSSELHDEEKQTYVFKQETITIGRATENDLCLPLRSISRRHARIVEHSSEYFLEDLESSSGTYVNRQRLQPRKSRQLRNGDQFLIFPYVFQVTVQELWSPETEVVTTFSSRLSATPASAFIAGLGSDLCMFQVMLHPDLGRAALALSRPFLTTILSRMTRDASLELVEGDMGLLEFVVVSILERANRELQFPFQCSLVPSNRFLLQDEHGLILEAVMKLQDACGHLSLFLPDTCLRRMRKAETPRLPLMVREQLMWKLSVRLGFAVLNLRDLENLEPGDMLLYTQQAQIVLPGTAPERGWDAEWRREEPSRLTVTRCFERSALMEENTNESQKTETTTEIELDSLPVQVSVLLQELEFSLHDLEGLKEGSIVEIGEIPEQVQLVVNGKVFGAGELVRIDDRLGVQITRWRKS